MVHYTIPASDNLPGTTLSCAPPSGSAFGLGVTTVVCNARDAAGNTASCSFLVTIVDTEPPVITVPTNIVQVAATGECSAVVNYTVTVTDPQTGTAKSYVNQPGKIASVIDINAF